MGYTWQHGAVSFESWRRMPGVAVESRSEIFYPMEAAYVEKPFRKSDCEEQKSVAIPGDVGLRANLPICFNTRGHRFA